MRILRFCAFSALFTLKHLLLTAQVDFAKVERNDYVKFKNYYKSDGVCSYEFTDIIQDGYGLMWFATQDGLMRFDGSTFRTYQGGNAKGQLPHSYVSSLALDKERNLWIGTKGGLCVYHPKTDSFERVDSLFGKPLPGHRFVRDIYVDSKGRLWVDRHNGTLNCIDFKNKTVETFQHEYNYNEIYHFHAITEFGEGVMIGGGSVNSIWLTRNPDKWNTFPSKEIKIEDKIITLYSTSNFYDDGTDYLWVASFPNYAFRLNKKSLEITPLPLPSVYTICSNGDGRVWMGGYHFGAILYNPSTNTATRFVRNDGNPESLSGNMIWCIYRDKQGNIWFGTTNGLSVLSAMAHRTQHLRKISDVNSLPSDQLTCLLPDYPKGIWMGTRNKGLVYYDAATKRFSRFGYSDSPDSIGSNWVTSIAKGGNNSLLITLWNGRGGGFNRYWLDKKRFQRFDIDKYYWYSSTIHTNDGKALAASWGLSIHEFDLTLNLFTPRKYFIHEQLNSNAFGETRKIIAAENGWLLFEFATLLNVKSKDTLTFAPKDSNTEKFEIPSEKRISISLPLNETVFYKNYLILLDIDGKIRTLNIESRKIGEPIQGEGKFLRVFADRYLYATTTHGISRWNEQQNRFEAILVDPKFPQVKSVADADNGVLLGTTEGLFLLEYPHNKLTKINNSEINSLTRFKKWIYAGTNNGLLRIHNSKVDKEYLSEQNISAVSIDSSGYLWVTNSEDLFRLSLTNEVLVDVVPYPACKDSLPSSQVRSLATDAMGDTWVLTDVCISKYISAEKRFESYYLPGKYSLQTSLTYKMFEDSKGFVWVGFTRDGVGVDRINRTSHTIEHFPHLPYDSTSYPKTSMTHCIFEDADGNMLFGTDKGLAILPPDRSGFRLITEKHGLPSPVVTAVNQDRLGNYWVGTDKGVARYSKKLKRVDLFGKQLGLQEGMINSIERWGFDTLIVAGDNGVNVFNPYIRGNDIPLEKTKIISCISDYDTLLNFPDKQKVYIRPNHKWLEIRFSSTDYTSPGKIAYTYWLEGFEDSAKAQVTTSQIVRYTNLPFGKYTFKVYYSRPDGSVSHEPATLSIVVGLPFYLRPWFFLVFLALIALSVYLHEIGRVRRVKRKRDELEKAVKEKTKEILLQNEELKSQAELIGQQSESLKVKTYQINESLEFAKSLQVSLMPATEEVEAILGSHFVMYKPKDTVSGDFYWIKGDYDNFIVIVADCTGHGVHGGFVSMMGLTLLTELYNHHKFIRPTDLIVEMHEHLVQNIGNELLKHNSNANIGMELAVCSVDRKKQAVSYASTHNPLYQLSRTDNSKAEILLHRSGGKAIGSIWFSPNILQVEVSVKPGDILLITTDGIFDQLSFADKKRFGRKQFEEVLLENPFDTVQNIGVRIESRLEAWQGKSAQTDDVTMVGFEV